jgi:hypothetical protein
VWRRIKNWIPAFAGMTMMGIGNLRDLRRHEMLGVVA